MAELAAMDFRVVAYDLRGSGRSEATPGPYSIDLLSEDLRALVETLGPRADRARRPFDGRADLADVRARHPGDVRALVGVGAPTGFSDEMRAALEARAATVEADGMDAVAATVAANAVAPTFRERSPEQLERLVALLAGNDARGYAAQCRAAAGVDLAGRLGAVKAPVLLVSGDLDGVTPATTAASTRRSCRTAGSRSSRTAVHTVTWERPGALAEAAWSFLLRSRR